MGKRWVHWYLFPGQPCSPCLCRFTPVTSTEFGKRKVRYEQPNFLQIILHKSVKFLNPYFPAILILTSGSQVKRNNLVLF